MEACPDPSLLDAFALGTIGAADRPALEQHLDRCTTCSKLASELMRIFAGGQSLGRSHDELALARTALARPSSHPPPAAPASIGRYRLLHPLGEGGMGVVFAAHDPDLDRTVALKLLHADPTVDPDQRKLRLAREAQAMAKLTHPNVVTVYDVGLDEPSGQLFVAMELVSGATLAHWTRSAQPNRRAVLDAFIQAGRGLSAAHAAGLVHRDFKPDNVFVGNDGRVRVGDFGLARSGGLSPAGSQGPELTATHTRHGAIVGTPAYMAPEQFRGEPSDARTDQFAFAIALFEALFGTRPFTGRSVGELSANVLAGNVLGLTAVKPRWLRGFFARALARDRAERFPSMDAALAVLGKDRTRLRRWLGVAGAGLAAAALLVLSFYLVARREPNNTLPINQLVSAAEATGLEPPSSSQARQDAKAIRAELSQLDDKLSHASSWESGPLKATAEALVARARTLGYDPVTAESLLRLAHAEVKLERPKQARDALDEVVRLSRASRHDTLLFDATIELVEIVGVALGQTDDAETWAGFALAEAKRSDSDPTRRARLEIAIGRVRARAGKLEDARQHLDEALRLHAAQSGSASMPVAEVLRERAYVRRGLGDEKGGLDDAQRAERIAAADSIVGQVGMATYSLTLGELLLAVGRVDDAITILDRAESEIVSPHRASELSLRTWDAKARAALAKGDVEGARAAAARSLAGFLQEGPDGKLSFYDPAGEARSSSAIDFANRIKSRVNKRDDPDTINDENAFACARAVEGSELAALAQLDKTLASALDNPVMVIGAIGAIKHNRALLLLRKGDLAGASGSIDEAREATAREVGADHLRYGVVGALRARILKRLGSPSADSDAALAERLIAARRSADETPGKAVAP